MNDTPGLSEEALQDQRFGDYVFGSISVKTPENLNNELNKTPNATDDPRNRMNQLETTFVEREHDSDNKKPFQWKVDMAQMAKKVLGKDEDPDDAENRNEVDLPVKENT